MKVALLAVVATLAMLAYAPIAGAGAVRINFSGAMGSGYADLTLGSTDPLDVVDPSKPPTTIVNAVGLFNGVAITGLEPLLHSPAPPGETMIPNAYSLFSIPGYGDHDGVSYDNLFYASGSPIICMVDGVLVYPFSGGFLDLMGIMFVLANGDRVDLWSFGVTPPGFFGPDWAGGLAYGIKVIQPSADGGWEVLAGPPFATASVPEPGMLWLVGVALVGLYARRRSPADATR